MIKLLICVPLLMVGAIFILMPNMTRRRILFAVPVQEDFRESNAGRRAITLFRTVVAIAVFAAVAAQLALPTSGLYAAYAPALLTLAAAGAYYKANRMVAPFRAAVDGERSMEVSLAPERLPRKLLFLAIGPLMLLGAAALFLYHRWDSIPEIFPVHWDITGTPDRWSAKTIKGVFGPLLFGAEICVWLSISGVASWFGARRSSLRSSVLELMVAVEYVIAFLFGFFGLLSILRIPVGLMLLVVITPAPIIIAFVIKKVSEPSDPPEKTAEECWKGGLIYYNTNDAALLVEKRTGFGYTFNFANPWAWALMAGLLLVVISAPLLLL